MPITRICCAFIALTLLPATVTADIIPPGAWRRPIILQVDQLPSGMVLLYLNRTHKLRSQVHDSKETLRISEAGTVYGAWVKHLSTPFSYERDRKELFALKTVEEMEIPSGTGSLPRKFLKCTLIPDGSAYAMRCSK